MARNALFAAAVALVLATASNAAPAADTPAPSPSGVAANPDTSVATNPLAGFARLIGGTWSLGDSHQEFEWGVGQTSVKSRSYATSDGERKLVSEGVWFWHPGENAVKGFATAIGMPVVFFDYTTRFEPDAIVSDLRSYTKSGKEQRYVERWTFTDDAHYEWKLLQESPEGLRALMGGTFAKE